MKQLTDKELQCVRDTLENLCKISDFSNKKSNGLMDKAVSLRSIELKMLLTEYLKEKYHVKTKMKTLETKFPMA